MHVTLGAAGLLACAGCSSSLAPLAPRESGAPPAPSPTRADAPATLLPTTASVFPITGLPTTSAKDLGRPAVAVVVAASDRVPPVGVQAADMVVEEVVRPGSRRLLAVFQSHDPRLVGPVGEARPVDSVLLPGWRAMYAYRGGKPSYVEQAVASGAVDVGDAACPEVPTQPTRRDGRLVSITTARAAPQARTAPRAWSVRSFVPADSAPAGSPPRLSCRPDAARARSAVLGLGAEPAALREPGDGSRGDQSGRPDRGVQDAAARDRWDRTERPGTRQGAVRVASGGRIVSGSWAEQQAGAQLHMFTRHGGVIGLAPGPTWELLAPPGTTIQVT